MTEAQRENMPTQTSTKPAETAFVDQDAQQQKPSQHVIIIGAGIAGLTAGIYARQSGFKTTIFESHSIPGGASTSWRRNGYLFEGGMHWLTGSSPKTALNAIWYEVGALDDDTPIHNCDPFCVCEFEEKAISVYRDLDTLRNHLIDISPEDKREIIKLCKDIKRFAEIDMPISNLKDVKMLKKPASTGISMLLSFPAFARMPFYAKFTIGEYAQRFKSPAIRHFMANLIGEDMSATGLLFTLATLTSGDGGYPEGGSLGMAKRMATYFEKLGGEIYYKTFVERVVIKDGRATGIQVNGNLMHADAVIITQDTLAAANALF
ncbi:MAG: NAD(P)/FAD-dependent oxidoreductase, partial [Raoultibacter sp.]